VPRGTVVAPLHLAYTELLAADAAVAFLPLYSADSYRFILAAGTDATGLRWNSVAQRSLRVALRAGTFRAPCGRSGPALPRLLPACYPLPPPAFSTGLPSTFNARG
jgi:hypothetical protein